MSKITKKQLQRDIELLESGIGMNWSDMKKIETRLNHAMNEMAQQLEALEEFATYADNMLTELNHALPDPEYDAKCEAQEADVDASLDRHRERLGLNKPQLKKLDQSVFDGLDEKWRFAMISSVGIPFVYDYKPTGQRHFLSDDATQQKIKAGKVMRIDEYDYDTSNWQNSLIERDKAKELAEVDLSSDLTGSELCRAMLARGDKFILCGVSDGDDSDAANHENDDFLAEAVTDFDDKDGLFGTTSMRWNHAVPINNQGEPLTASEVGL